jgi:hypothetical protein
MQEDYSDYKLRESVRENIKNSTHYPTNYNEFMINCYGAKRDGRILSRRGRDDRPQEESSKNKVKTLTKRRVIRKNLSDLI